MAHCPKCGFDGRNEDQCERCGIIFEKMHTILEVRPLGLPPAPPKIMLGGPKSDPQEAPTVQVKQVPLAAAAPPRVAAALARSAQAEQGGRGFDRDATNLEVPLVPRVEADRPKSRTGMLLAILAVMLVVWGFMQWREERAARAREDARVENTTDAAYFDVSLETLLDDARRNLKTVGEPGAAQFELERMTARVRHLEQALATSPLEVSERQPYADALEAMEKFLTGDVAPAIAAARAEPGRADPVPSWNLTKAAQALQRARDGRLGGVAPPPEAAPVVPENPVAAEPAAPEAAPAPAPAPAAATGTTP